MACDLAVAARRIARLLPPKSNYQDQMVERGPRNELAKPVLKTIDGVFQVVFVRHRRKTGNAKIEAANTAIASPITFDPNLANNSATLVTRVSGK
jgi:hypothetical protein